jgi:hypothetical protein
MYFPDFEHDRKYEEAAKEREEYEGIRTWLGGVSAENEKGMGGDVEAGETEQDQEDEDEYVDVKREMEMDWPEELCDFHDHEVWSVNTPTLTHTSPTSPNKQTGANETEATAQGFDEITTDEDDESRSACLESRIIEEMNLLRFPPPPRRYGRIEGVQYMDGETGIEIPSLEDRILGTLGL